MLVTLLVLVVLGAAALALVWRLNVYTLDMALRGDAAVTMEYGTDYNDPGASASFSGSLLLRQEQDVPVVVQGNVDTSRVGVYELTYRAEITYRDLFWERTESRELKRTVHVVDTQAPTIILTVQEGYYTLPGRAYQEEGYSATDGYDGDLTDRVVCTVLNDSVVYMVTDSSGNVVQVTRRIVYDDPVAPELELEGSAEMTLTEGDVFTDPGCYAYDNCDGDLTGSVTVSGTVDTDTPGTYNLTYTVTDGWGNTSSIDRTVTVEEKPAPPPTEPPVEDPPATEPPPTEPLPEIPDEPLPPNGKVIYLTFDDGPGKHTARLLDILAKYDVKATFFVIHTGYMDILPRMAEEGHTIAMHAYNHSYSAVYASDEAYLADLKQIQDEIFAYTGQTANIIRFPGGSSNTVSQWTCSGIMTRMTQKVEEMGYRYYDWNVDSNDAGGANSSDEVYYNVVTSIARSGRQNFVVLQHDIWGFSVNAVERIIQWGLANGYTFEALTLDSPACEHGVNN